MRHSFVTAQGSAYMRFRRALDRGNKLTLLLSTGDLEKYNRAALRWHVRFIEETKNVDIRESQAVLALLTAIPVNALAAAALAELRIRHNPLSSSGSTSGVG